MPIGAMRGRAPVTQEGRQRSRCNAVRHGLTAETVIAALEDAEDYHSKVRVREDHTAGGVRT
jgi:hypothetical protein